MSAPDRSSATLQPCPKCGRTVEISPSYGGTKGSGLTAYVALCKCGLEVDHLGAGSMRSGIAAWNKYAKEEKGA